MNEQDKKLNETRALLEAATGTSWIRKNGQILCRLGSGDLLKLGGGFDANDAALIAAAPEALAYTLDIIARQEAEIKEAEARADYWEFERDEAIYKLGMDVANLIEDRDRLSAESKAKDARIEALEAERDAVVIDLAHSNPDCGTCAFTDCAFDDEPCNRCFNNERVDYGQAEYCWQWRGLARFSKGGGVG